MRHPSSCHGCPQPHLHHAGKATEPSLTSPPKGPSPWAGKENFPKYMHPEAHPDWSGLMIFQSAAHLTFGFLAEWLGGLCSLRWTHLP